MHKISTNGKAHNCLMQVLKIVWKDLKKKYYWVSLLRKIIWAISNVDRRSAINFYKLNFSSLKISFFLHLYNRFTNKLL